MNTPWTCEQCTKKYKTLTGFKKHKCKRRNKDPPQKNPPENPPENPQKKPPENPPEKPQKKPPEKPQKKPKKKKISPQIRFDVWKTYIGDKIEAKCFCCWKARITPFTYNNTFHAGHIKSEANGGRISIDNLLPICSDCNKDMSTTNWDEYIKTFTNFRPRIYGEKIPLFTQNKAKQIQKWYKKISKQPKQPKQPKQSKQPKRKPKRKRKLKRKPNYLKPTISSQLKHII